MSPPPLAGASGAAGNEGKEGIDGIDGVGSDGIDGIPIDGIDGIDGVGRDGKEKPASSVCRGRRRLGRDGELERKRRRSSSCDGGDRGRIAEVPSHRSLQQSGIHLKRGCWRKHSQSQGADAHHCDRARAVIDEQL